MGVLSKTVHQIRPNRHVPDLGMTFLAKQMERPVTRACTSQRLQGTYTIFYQIVTAFAINHFFLGESSCSVPKRVLRPGIFQTRVFQAMRHTSMNRWYTLHEVAQLLSVMVLLFAAQCHWICL